ncbi:hypothetical protein HC891_12075 [Candidatus Gracilibacteria bacterium]|nr:hypothetical protein [Candidatus Gracilibacteria bacterium]
MVVSERQQLQRLSTAGSYAAHMATSAFTVVLVAPAGYEFDLGQAAAYMQLAAVEHGVGSCVTVLHDHAAARVMLDVPEDLTCCWTITFGYSAEAPPPPKKGGRPTARCVGALRAVYGGAMKTIGVLGGLGPQATIDFEQRLHRVAQRLTSQQGDTVYPPLVSWFFRELPVLMPVDGSSPSELPPVNPRLLEAAQALGSHADFLVITSNGVHIWQTEIEAAAGKPVVSMVDAVVAEVQRRGCRLLGLVDFRPAAWSVYPPRLEQLGLSWVELSALYRDSLAEVMRAVNTGRNSYAEEAQLRLAISILRMHHADGIILACTEFPLALSGALDPDLINPAELLAETAARAALDGGEGTFAALE